MNPIKPFPGELEEAKRYPSGWVYRIAGNFDASERVPREAIVGAWKVDLNGNLVGPFQNNPNYDAERWPSSS